MRRMLSLALYLLVSLALNMAVELPALAGPAIDPRAMSGIPRPDPQVPPGTVTVRALRGGFDAPATGVEISLEVTAPTGAKQLHTATTDAQGRATFSGLDDSFGGTAIARVTLDGEPLTSQPIELLAQAGSRVMLVAGAGAPANPHAAAPAHGQPGGAAMPLPGVAFPLEGMPAGQLTVGAFDLAARAPLPGIEISLSVTRPNQEPEVRKGTTDDQGKVVFDKLAPPDLPEGTEFIVSGVLESERQESKPFAMNAPSGMAVVLTRGNPPVEAEPGSMPVPPPRRLQGMPGTVRVHIQDPQGAPVAGQEVALVRKTMAGLDSTSAAVTDASGTVDILATASPDAFFTVKTIYGGGPYSSEFFQMDARDGVSVDLRVWPTTDDISVVASVVQFDVDGLENDLARVVQIQDVRVTGDKAFWAGPQLKIAAAEGATGVDVLRVSEDFLSHDEKAPFATLSGPLLPGEVTRLALIYLVHHDGTVTIHWSSPFDLLETSVFVGPDLTLDAPGSKPADHESAVPDKTSYLMGPRSVGSPLEFEISGLLARPRIYREVGLWGGLLLGLVVVVALASTPRIGHKARLEQQRDQLLALLETIPATQEMRRHKIVAALDRIWRQIEVLEHKQADGSAKRRE